MEHLVSREPGLGSGTGGNEGSLAHMLPARGLCPALWGCLARRSAFARPLLPPGVSGRGAVPWLHLGQGNELPPEGGVQHCSEFCTQGQHLGPTFSQSQAWVLGPAETIPSRLTHSASHPIPCPTPDQCLHLHQHPNWKPSASGPLDTSPSNQCQGSVGP